MSLQLSHTTMMEMLNWTYDRATGTLPKLGSIKHAAAGYRKRSDAVQDQAKAVVAWHTTTAATSGFLAGAGGLIALPVTVPLNIASVLLIQLRMVATIAHLGGYNIRDDQVRTFCYVCLCGSSAKDLLKGVGVTIGTKMTAEAIKQIPGTVLIGMNQAVGFRMVTKFGETGVVNLGKAIPIAGGVIGGGFDGLGTYVVGKVARSVFVPRQA